MATEMDFSISKHSMDMKHLFKNEKKHVTDNKQSMFSCQFFPTQTEVW